MSKVTLDPASQSKLDGLSEPAELGDESGRTVGQFLPASYFEKLMYRIAEWQCPDTPEKLERMRQQKGGRGLQEIWTSVAR